MAHLAVIVVSWNTCALLAESLASVAEATAGLDVEAIVVDNASTDGSAAMVRADFPTVRLLVNATNVGFARANNLGVAATDAALLLLLNSDARLGGEALQRLLARMRAAPRAGVIGAELRNPDGTFQYSHAPFPTLGMELLMLSGLGRKVFGSWYPSRGPRSGDAACTVDWVGGACMLARRAAFEAVAGFDEGYELYGEEVDLCYRLRRAGWEVWYEPAARVVHHGGAGTSQLASLREAHLYRSRLRFFRLHYGPAAAALLATQILLCTTPKIVAHGALRRLSGGRIGRTVIGWRALRDVVADPLAPLALPSERASTAGSDARAGAASDSPAPSTSPRR